MGQPVEGQGITISARAPVRVTPPVAFSANARSSIPTGLFTFGIWTRIVRVVSVRALKWTT